MASHHNGFVAESIRSEIARVAPEFAGEAITRLGEGMDSIAFSVGGTYVFRFAKHAEAAAGLRREIALLPRLAARLPLVVPRHEYVGEHSGTSDPFVGYRLIRGEPLDRALYNHLPEAQREGVLADLADFLDAVHAFPAEEAAGCGVARHGHRADYLEDLRRAQNDVFPLLADPVRHRVESRLAAFLDDDAHFADAPTLLHGDLWPEHVLYSRADGRLAGVIDFGDLCLGDPAYDLAFLALRLGPGFLADLLRLRPHGDPARLAEKIHAIALFNAIEDIFFGLEQEDRTLVDSGLAELSELTKADPESRRPGFPAGPDRSDPRKDRPTNSLGRTGS
jgi:aminoglycoside 2''-phosphotransferase